MKFLDTLKAKVTGALKKLWNSLTDQFSVTLKEVRQETRDRAGSSGSGSSGDVQASVSQAQRDLKSASDSNEQLHERLQRKAAEYKKEHPTLSRKYAKMAEKAKQRGRRLNQVSGALRGQKASATHRAPKASTKRTQEHFDEAKWIAEMEQRTKDLSKPSSSVEASPAAPKPKPKSKPASGRRGVVRRRVRKPRLSKMTKYVIRDLPKMEREAEKLERDASERLERTMAEAESKSRELGNRVDYMSNRMAEAASSHIPDIDAKVDALLREAKEESHADLLKSMPSVPKGPAK